MAYLNKCLIIGNLGRDPEMKYTPNGNPVTTFSVATNRRWKDSNDEWQDETEWFNVECWNRLAETCNEYIRKGSKVFVEGRLRTRSWEKDGARQYRTELVAQRVLFLDRKEAGQ